MRVGNVFGRVCPSVHICVAVCSGYNFWTASHRNFILAWRYILTISRLSSSIKVTGQGQGHVQKMIIYLFQFIIPLGVTTGH